MLPLYLASASPRRRELLHGIGLELRIVRTGIDETPLPHEAPTEMVCRLAEAKGRAAVVKIGSGRPPGIVLAADTAVLLDDVYLGKPTGPDDARAMLRRLSGRMHEVLTGVFLLRGDDGRSTVGLDRTRVRFRDLDEATVEAYVACGESADKAGAYGIQGRGVLLTDRIDGSWSNVVGLPLERLQGWMAEIGVDLWDLL